MPFSVRQSPGWLISLYQETLSSYAYATLNTANLYYLIGANWTSLEAHVPMALPLVTALAAMSVGLWLLLDGEKLSLRAQPRRASLGRSVCCWRCISSGRAISELRLWNDGFCLFAFGRVPGL